MAKAKKTEDIEITTLEQALEVISEKDEIIAALQKEVENAVESANKKVADASKQISGATIISHEGEQYQVLKSNLLLPKVGKVTVKDLETKPEIVQLILDKYPNILKKIN